MMRWACFLTAWVFITVSLPAVSSADALRKVERTTSGGSQRTHSESSTSSSSSNRGYDGGGQQGCGLLDQASCESRDSSGFGVFAFTIGSPWTIPRMFFDHPTLVGYAPYPFANGPGLLRTRSEQAPDAARTVAIALDVESGYMLQGVVPSGVALRVLLPHRLELDARFTGLTDVNERPVEVASAGTAHMIYRFAQGLRYDFRTGLGLRMFALDAPRLGIDILYGVDTYLGPNIVWRMELHLGSAGDAFVGQARSTIGAMLHRFELYAGYDHTAYINADGRAALGGPIAGLRAWF
ncbi:MAG TPA: hypothetical protein VI299_15880 [Polyangiales bacterium]